MPVSLPYTFATETIVDGTKIDAQFAALRNKFSAGIVASDLSATAGLVSAQLAEPYEFMDVQLSLTTASAGFAGDNPLNTYIAVAPLPNPGGVTEASWNVTNVTYWCADAGAGAATFRVDYVWMNVAVITQIQAVTNITAVAAAGDGVMAIANGTLSFNPGAGATTPFHLALYSVAQSGAGFLTGGNNWDQFIVTCHLRRALQST